MGVTAAIFEKNAIGCEKTGIFLIQKAKRGYMNVNSLTSTCRLSPHKKDSAANRRFFGKNDVFFAFFLPVFPKIAKIV